MPGSSGGAVSLLQHLVREVRNGLLPCQSEFGPFAEPVGLPCVQADKLPLSERLSVRLADFLHDPSIFAQSPRHFCCGASVAPHVNKILRQGRAYLASSNGLQGTLRGVVYAVRLHSSSAAQRQQRGILTRH